VSNLITFSISVVLPLLDEPTKHITGIDVYVCFILKSLTVMLYSITQDYKKFHVFFSRTPSRYEVISSYLLRNSFASIERVVPPPL